MMRFVDRFNDPVCHAHYSPERFPPIPCDDCLMTLHCGLCFDYHKDSKQCAVSKVERLLGPERVIGEHPFNYELRATYTTVEKGSQS